MKEDFLHLLWQQQLYVRQEAALSDQTPFSVLKTGLRNRHSGPDFEQAKLVIDHLEWVGSVEIHVRASEWNQHGHFRDPAYQSVILHVVWEKDTEVFRLDGSSVPTLELKDKVPLEVLIRYREMMNPLPAQLPCTPFLSAMEPLRMAAMQERVLVERLERKANEVLEVYRRSGKDWQETAVQMVAYALGLKENAEPMAILARSVPVRIFAAFGWNAAKILPVLLGQAGFLEDSGNKEVEKMRKEYLHHKQKSGLSFPDPAWRKFRIRPSAFPLNRVIFLAWVLSEFPVWFPRLMEGKINPGPFIPPSEKPVFPEWAKALQALGIQDTRMRLSPHRSQLLEMNFKAPFLAALALHKGDSHFLETALEEMHRLPAESNSIVRMWERFGITCTDGGQSQALLELFNGYCQKKRCMECAIGAYSIRLDSR